MASIFDISLLSTFSDVFVILFIFAAVYGVLSLKNPFGEQKGINALISASIALIFIFSQDAIAIIRSTIPWYVLIMILLLFTYMIVTSIGGVMPDTIMKSIGTWVLIISVFIFILNVSQRLGQKAGPYLSEGENGTMVLDPDNVVAGEGGDVATDSFSQNLGATLFHPKVLAMMVVILVAVFAVLWIGNVAVV